VGRGDRGQARGSRVDAALVPAACYTCSLAILARRVREQGFVWGVGGISLCFRSGKEVSNVPTRGLGEEVFKFLK
jgi:hypothetical protein